MSLSNEITNIKIILLVVLLMRALAMCFRQAICKVRYALNVMSCKPLQGNSSHVTVSTAGPLQLFPPQDGTGSVQLLVLSLTQETKQLPTDQSDHPPSTIISDKNKYNYKQ